MKSGKQKLTSLIFVSIACLFVICTNGIAHAGFDSFVIRNGTSGSPTIQPNDSYVAGATEFIINEGGMKAGWGSNDINNITINQIVSLSITRYDDPGRFTAGSGPAVAPYFNIWVTDGNGNYAVIANEPSNPAFQPLFIDNGDGSHTYDLSFNVLINKIAKVYETCGLDSDSSWVHDRFGPDPLTFNDLATLKIAPPPPIYIQNATDNCIGSGAPVDINDYTARGFNWIFGDTLSNYISGDEGYVVASPVAAGPPPTYSCVGFNPPLDTAAINVKNNKRVLPFKAKLVDEQEAPVTDINPPMLECNIIGGGGSTAVLVEDFLPVGKGTDGNQFELTGDGWQYNLKLWNFGPSTYECYMIPGNGYDIDQTCTVEVQIQD